MDRAQRILALGAPVECEENVAGVVIDDVLAFIRVAPDILFHRVAIEIFLRDQSFLDQIHAY